MNARALPLGVERLEEREVPAVFGVPWLDGSNLTLSFAPDGTPTQFGGSVLSQMLAPLGGDAAKLEILRAFQTWVENANINIGVVPDGGQPFASNGSIQGDARFGDIRLFGSPLQSNQLAVTSPFNVLGGTNAGDVTLNSKGNFSIGGQNGTFDVYSLMLQEAGHTLGIGNSADPNSPMFEDYSGVRAGLSAGDIANLQALYGPRIPDRYEKTGGPLGLLGLGTNNDTPANASLISNYVDAELTTRADVDCYKFVATSGSALIQLQAAGHSLMTGRLSVLDSRGRVVATATAADPLHNNLTLAVTNLQLLGSYVVKVDSPQNNVFSVGSYRLIVNQDPNAVSLLGNTVVGLATGTSEPLNTSTLQNYGDDHGTNDSISTATPVPQRYVNADPRYDYNLRATISTATDVDYYSITAPLASTLDNPTGQMYMIATVWGLNSALDPRLQVYDQYQNFVAARILANNDGSFTVQVNQPAADQIYYLRISADHGTVGDYELAVDFRTSGVQLDQPAAGSLTANSQQSAPLYLCCQNQLFHFALTAGPEPAAINESVEMDIYDMSGNLVYSLSAAAGDTLSDDVFLATGVYVIRFKVRGPLGTPIFPIDYALAMASLTDPIVSSSDTTAAPSSGSSGNGSGSTSSSGSTYSYSNAPPPSNTTWY
jgi:hypothetical protein